MSLADTLAEQIAAHVAGAREVIHKAENEDNRSLTKKERDIVDHHTREAAKLKSDIEHVQAVNEDLAGLQRGLSGPGGGDSVLARFKAAGFDPASNPRASIPFRDFYVAAKAGTLESGDLDALNRIQTEGAPLGYDARRLYPNLPMQAVDSGATSVETFRQLSRTLASPASMQRAIDATSTKPTTSTGAEIESLSLQQVATVNPGIPNVLLARPAFTTMVQQDLRLAFEDAVDDLVVDAIAAADTTPSAFGMDTFSSVREAIKELTDAGYSPDLVALSSEMHKDLDLFRDGGTNEQYAFATTARQTGIAPLFGLKVAVVKNLVNAFVLDTKAAGRLYLSPVELRSFEENDGSTNTTLVRIEAHGAFGVERPTAITEILSGS